MCSLSGAESNNDAACVLRISSSAAVTAPRAVHTRMRQCDVRRHRTKRSGNRISVHSSLTGNAARIRVARTARTSARSPSTER